MCNKILERVESCLIQEVVVPWYRTWSSVAHRGIYNLEDYYIIIYLSEEISFKA